MSVVDMNGRPYTPAEPDFGPEVETVMGTVPAPRHVRVIVQTPPPAPARSSLLWQIIVGAAVGFAVASLIVGAAG